MADLSRTVPPSIEPLSAEEEISPAVQDNSQEADVELAETQRPDAEWTAEVTVKNSRVNIRSGPGLAHQPIATAAAGTAFKTDGREEGGWWHICCFPAVNDEPDMPTLMAWVSGTVVEPNPDALALPVLQPLFPEDVQVEWDVTYRCGSDSCGERMCTAQATAKERSDIDRFWLVLDREVVWDDECGQNSSHRHQVDRFTGRDVYDLKSDLFLTQYWRGVSKRPGNSIYTRDDGQKVSAWCMDELQSDVEAENGWFHSYDGAACYDTRTGMLLSMKYVKRWLYTGEFEGRVYDREYLGDFELFEVTLDSTNVELAYR